MRPHSPDHVPSAHLFINGISKVLVGVALLQGCMHDSVTAVVGHSQRLTSLSHKSKWSHGSQMDNTVARIMKPNAFSDAQGTIVDTIPVEMSFDEVRRLAGENGLGNYDWEPVELVGEGSAIRQPMYIGCRTEIKESVVHSKPIGNNFVYSYQMDGNVWKLSETYTVCVVHEKLDQNSPLLGIHPDRYATLLVPTDSAPPDPNHLANNMPPNEGNTLLVYVGQQAPDPHSDVRGPSVLGFVKND